MRSILDNFRSHFAVASASPVVMRDAAEWYPLARLHAHAVALVGGWSLESAASVLAAFSPRTRWTTNLRHAAEYASGGTPRCLRSNLRMADAAVRDGFAAVRGPKVGPFARAIAGDSEAVVQDSWMVFAAANGADSEAVATSRRTGKMSTKAKAPGVRMRREMDAAIRLIAAETALAPTTVQAAVWIAVRGRGD